MNVCMPVVACCKLGEPSNKCPMHDFATIQELLLTCQHNRTTQAQVHFHRTINLCLLDRRGMQQTAAQPRLAKILTMLPLNSERL